MLLHPGDFLSSQVVPHDHLAGTPLLAEHWLRISQKDIPLGGDSTVLVASRPGVVMAPIFSNGFAAVHGLSHGGGVYIFQLAAHWDAHGDARHGDSQRF